VYSISLQAEALAVQSASFLAKVPFAAQCNLTNLMLKVELWFCKISSFLRSRHRSSSQYQNHSDGHL